MAKKKSAPNINCGNYNSLISICTVLGKICDASDPTKCDFSDRFISQNDKPIEKPVIKKESKPKTEKIKPIDSAPIIEKPKVNDMPKRPKFFTIEEQLRELGVEPSPLQKTIDKLELEAEVISITPQPEGYVMPKYERIDHDKIEYEFDEVGDHFCGIIGCHSKRFWRSKQLGEYSDWKCDYCFPSPITPDRTVKSLYKPGEEPKPVVPFMPKAYDPNKEMALDDF